MDLRDAPPRGHTSDLQKSGLDEEGMVGNTGKGKWIAWVREGSCAVHDEWDRKKYGEERARWGIESALFGKTYRKGSVKLSPAMYFQALTALWKMLFKAAAKILMTTTAQLDTKYFSVKGELEVVD